MSEWIALTTPERTDWTGDVMAYSYYPAEGHYISKMGMRDGKIKDMWYDQGVLLTTAELFAIPPVADLLAASEDAAELLRPGSHALKALDAAIAKAGEKTK